MPDIPFLTLAGLTRDVEDAGSGDRLNVTINVNGIDVAVAEFVAERPDAQGYLRRAEAVVSFNSESLTNSSVRVGNRGDDAWAPQHILLFGHTTRESVVPIAMETDLTEWLSSDASEGALTVPLRLVGLGGSDMLVHRLLLLVRTADKDDAGTDSLVQLQVTINGQLHVSEVITDTPQDDLERGVSNWYYLPVQTPFTRQGLQAGTGRMELEILGTDAWLPDSLYVFGLDTADGRPTKLVPLAAKRIWGGLVLSRDPDEGSKTVGL
jgi:hypothetical protein